MLSLETERRLAQLLNQIIECERTIEHSRQDLCRNPNFDPYGAFNAIDRLAVRGLSLSDLRDFQSRVGIFSTSDDLNLLIKQYDSDNDGRLSMTDFFQLVLSSQNPTLRQIAESRRCEPPLTYSVELVLARHLQLQASLQAQLEGFKRELAVRYDYSDSSAFRSIDRQSLGLLNSFQILDFLRRNGFTVYQQDMDNVLRRVDTDGDGRLGYSEFIQGIIPSNLSRALESSPRATRSPARNASPLRQTSPLRESPSYRSPSRSSKGASNSDLGELVSVFKQQIDLARKFEETKISLVQQTDFTLLDFFRLIDLQDKGFIFSSDLRSFLTDLNVFHTADDVYLIESHFKGYLDSKIKLSDFQEMWVPKDPYFANLLIGRSPLAFPPQDRMNAFSPVTVDKITQAFRDVVEYERIAEDIRKRISVKRWISLWDVFRSIDRLCDDAITIDEFEMLFREFGVYASEKDMEGLVDRYDKDKDRRVSYTEFIQELTPKINQAGFN